MRWKFSHLKNTCAPVSASTVAEVSTGVRFACSLMRSCARAISSKETMERILPARDLQQRLSERFPRVGTLVQAAAALPDLRRDRSAVVGLRPQPHGQLDEFARRAGDARVELELAVKAEREPSRQQGAGERDDRDAEAERLAARVASAEIERIDDEV